MIQFLVICLLVLIANADPIRKSDGRIIGGKEIPIEEAPYQISIRKDDQHSCGGSIISSKYVLTAAHCVSVANMKKMSIRAGSANRELGGGIYKIVNIIRHRYKMTPNRMPMNDIALLEVNPPFKFGETCAPISLFQLKEEAIPGSVALISGWGRTLNSSKPIYLEAVQVPMVSKEDCRKAYKNLPDGEICAMHSLGGKDSCQGDSGGPLVIDERLAGIVSWGYGCGIKGKPGVYTEVAYYANWIEENTGL